VALHTPAISPYALATWYAALSTSNTSMRLATCGLRPHKDREELDNRLELPEVHLLIREGATWH
jgi:hypothetical protein